MGSAVEAMIVQESWEEYDLLGGISYWANYTAGIGSRQAFR